MLCIGEGDSITAGDGTSGGSNWVAQLAYFINDSKVSLTNIALSGDTISNNVSASDTLLRLAMPDFNRRVAMIDLGSNDICNGIGDSAETIQTNLLYWFNNVRSNYPAAKIVALTIMPRSGCGGAKIAVRTNVNNWIVSNAPVDLAVDVAADARLQTAPGGAYFADAAHPNNLGSWVMASNVWFSINAAGFLDTRNTRVLSATTINIR